MNEPAEAFASSLIELLIKCGTTGGKWDVSSVSKLIEADRAAIATAADRAGYERALRDVALSPGSYGLRHVLEALRQMPSKSLTSAPVGEPGCKP